MKWIIYTLLLTNLSFGLWHFYRSQELTYAQDTQQDEALRLVLLSEFLADQKPVAAAASDAKRCYSLGPVSSKSKATALRDSLAIEGISAKYRLNKDKTRQGFWVIIPAENKRADAKKHIQLLKNKGVKDYFLVVTGQHTNAVSLGVFSRFELAQRRYEDIQRYGVKLQIEKVDLPQREYWLDWPQDKPLSPTVLDELRQRFPGIGQTDRACSF